jgi:hypothetical protein
MNGGLFVRNGHMVITSDSGLEVEIVPPLNPGIVKLVTLLYQNGFYTCDSGDGKTHDYECDRDHAYVSMTVDPDRLVEETRRLQRVLRDHGVELFPQSPEDRPFVQASFDPANEFAVIDLCFVDDTMIKEPA